MPLVQPNVNNDRQEHFVKLVQAGTRTAMTSYNPHFTEHRIVENSKNTKAIQTLPLKALTEK